MSAAPAARPVTIRDAAPADFPKITAIYAHHVLTGLGTFEEVAPSQEEMMARFAQVTGLGLPYLVATGGGGVLGYGYAAPYRPRSAYRFTVEDSIYVAHDMLRQGIGTALLRAVVVGCAAASFKQMVAVIGDSANAASIRLHLSCGFRGVGTLTDVGFKSGRWVDSVVMQRGL
jgi:L-amino acid N-acyltransferase YncA